MADVTDAAFRRVIAHYSRMGEVDGGPDALWTEFVSADGLVKAPWEGKEKLLRDLMFTDKERPIVAQFFSAEPEMMKCAAELAVELGFDGIDINMGCPDRSIEKQGAGAALIKDPERAQAVISAAQEWAGELPVSVKTRIGYSRNEIEEWIPALLSTSIAALTVHLRTRKEMSKVPAHWDLAERIVELRDKEGVDTLIVGNGDVLSLSEAKQKVNETGVDGVMLGKGIFGNPWLFDQTKKEVSVEEKLKVLVEHTKHFEQLLGDVKSFAVMKKHYKAYVNDFDGAKELRIQLMEAQSAHRVEEIVGEFLRQGS